MEGVICNRSHGHTQLMRQHMQSHTHTHTHTDTHAHTHTLINICKRSVYAPARMNESAITQRSQRVHLRVR